MMPLAGELIVDLSTGRAGGYCGKLLVDAGADVVKVEPPAGDPLRRHAGGKPDVDSALFRHLAGSKRSVVTDIRSADDTANLIGLIGVADGVIWSPGSEIAAEPRFSPASIRAVAGEATVVSLSPFGLEGPWAGRPANEATLQAMCGGASQRGTLATPPLIVGGGLGDFETGLVGAVAYLLARARRVRDGGGELVDVSALEAECLTMVMYGATYASMAGVPMRSVRMTNLPGIHASRDGYVGFMVVTGQQWLDFAAMVERPDWVDDESLLKFQARGLRKAELLGTIDRWMGERTSEEIADLANAFRIPVAILGNGATVPEADHFVDQHWFEPHPGGDFVQPTVPYRFGGSATSRPLGAAPMLGEHTGSVQELIARRQSVAATVTESSTTTGARPLAGIRIIDFCNNWAGPIIAHVCGMFGADVIKVESAAR
ncbi:MAG: Formyl-CoA transferase, partial [Ilumatobacteraceae bacterium]|nr:Formyl-CoA transferase [Ilumatobacteraceae bacterium]